MTVLLVALGAAVGAPLRYLVDRAVQSWHETRFPWGTFAVNTAGSLILGVLIGGAAGAVPAAVGTALGTGLCGALTTYSTFGYETVRLVAGRATALALGNAVGSIAAGWAAAVLGVTAARAVWG